MPTSPSGMRGAFPDAGAVPDDSYCGSRAWDRGAPPSTSPYDGGYASDDAEDLRDRLDAAEAARAALRQVASTAAAEREMAVEACASARAERDRLRSEMAPLRAALAKATESLARREDEARSMRFKTDQLLRHARDRDRRERGVVYFSEDEEEEGTGDAGNQARRHASRALQKEERVYVEALATASACLELELRELHAELRACRVQRDGAADECARLRDENAVLRARIANQESHANDARVSNGTSTSTTTCTRRDGRPNPTEIETETGAERRTPETSAAEASAAEASAAAASIPAERVLSHGTNSAGAHDGFGGECFSGRSVEGTEGFDSVILGWNESLAGGKENPPTESDADASDPASESSTARAYATLASHRASIQKHLEALQRDRDRLAAMKEK